MPRLVVRNYPAALSFDAAAATNQVSFAHISAYTFSNVVSCSFWVKARSLQSDAEILGKNNAARYPFVFRYNNSTGRVQFGAYDGTFNPSTPANTALKPSDGWVHFVGTRDGVNLKLYRNSVLISTVADTTLSTTDNSDAVVVGNRGGSTKWFDGIVSDVNIFAATLTQAQIDGLYYNDIRATSVLTARLIDGAGLSALDTSSNANAGTITGATFVYDSPMKSRKSVNGNMLPNGDFTFAPRLIGATTGSAVWVDGSVAGSANDLFGWYKINGAGAFAATFDSATTYQGKPSIKLESTNSTGRGRLLSAPTETNTTAAIIAKYGIPVKPATSYTLSANIKTAGADAASVRLIWLFYTADGTQSGGGTGTNQSSTQDFTQVSQTFVTGSATCFVVIKLDDNVATAVAHQTWFNQVSLVPTYPDQHSPLNGNLVRNGDFEIGSGSANTSTSVLAWVGSNSLGWGAGAQGSVTGSVAYDATKSHSGGQSIKVMATSITGTVRAAFAANAHDNPSSTNSVANADNNKIPVLPNTTYDFSVWVWNNSVAGSQAGNVIVTDFTALGAQIGGKLNLTTSGSGAWENLTGRFVTASNAVYVQILLRAQGVTSDTPIVWFDDVSLVAVYKEQRTPVYGNLVSNADFETVPVFTAVQNTAGTWLNGTAGGSGSNASFKWSIPSAAISASASASFDTTVFHNGSASLKLDVTDASGSVVASTVLNSAIGGTVGSIKIKPSTAYSFSAWVKTSNVGSNGVYMDVRQFNSLGGTITTTSSNKLSGTNDWTQITGSFTSDSAAKDVCIILRNGVTGQVSTAWFDEIVLIPTTPVARTAV